MIVTMSRLEPTITDLGGEVKILLRQTDPVDRNWSALNPSIARGPDGTLMMMIRSSNYTIHDDGIIRVATGGKIRSRNWLCRVDPEDLSIHDLREIGIFGKYMTRGAEDARLFHRESGWYFTAVMFDPPELAYARMALFSLDMDRNEARMLKILPGVDDEKPEKNWMTPDVRSPHFDYVYSATQTYKDGKVVGNPSERFGFLRGGSGLVLQEDGTYLAVVHDMLDKTEKKMDPSGMMVRHIYSRWYRHYFARYSAEGHLIALSEPFIFKRPGIEFASGMVEHDGNLIISYGARDVYACLARIPKETVCGLLNPTS